jgi:dihydrofolate reductase
MHEGSAQGRSLDKLEERQMGKIVVSEFVSLDGVMEDPGGAEGTPHGGWTIPYWNDEIATFKKEELFAAESMLLGRVTYDGFAAAWPTMSDADGFADRMNSIAKYVVTSRLDTLTWSNSARLEGDVASAVRALKDRVEGSILVGGSATLVHALVRHSLVDEFRLVVCPVSLGGGKRVFDDGVYTRLELTDEQRTSTGAVLLSYRAQSEQ